MRAENRKFLVILRRKSILMTLGSLWLSSPGFMSSLKRLLYCILPIWRWKLSHYILHPFFSPPIYSQHSVPLSTHPCECAPVASHKKVKNSNILKLHSLQSSSSYSQAMHNLKKRKLKHENSWMFFSCPITPTPSLKPWTQLTVNKPN